MRTLMRTKLRPAILAAALAALVVGIVPPAASALDGSSGTGATSDAAAAAAYCARQLDVATRADMESFRDFDADTFRAGHDPRAITVFPSGRVAVGIDEIMRLLAPHFTDRNATFTWTERGRTVEGCKTALVWFDARYDIDSANIHQHQVIVVTWIWKHGRWLAISDTNTFTP